MFLFHQVLTTGEWLGQEDNLDPDTQLLSSMHAPFTGPLGYYGSILAGV